MNRFNKIVALFSLVALIGAQNAVAESSVDALKREMKQFSRDVNEYSKCLRTGKQCDPEIKARLVSKAKVLGVMVAGLAAVGGVALGARQMVRNIVPVPGSFGDMGGVLNPGIDVRSYKQEKRGLNALNKAIEHKADLSNFFRKNNFYIVLSVDQKSRLINATLENPNLNETARKALNAELQNLN